MYAVTSHRRDSTNSNKDRPALIASFLVTVERRKRQRRAATSSVFSCSSSPSMMYEKKKWGREREKKNGRVRCRFLLSSHTRSRSSDDSPRLLAPTLRCRRPFVHHRQRVSRLCRRRRRRSLAHRANVVDLPSSSSPFPNPKTCSSRTTPYVTVYVVPTHR